MAATSSGELIRKPTPRTVRRYDGLGRVVAQLAAQLAHVHVQRLGGAEPVGVPDVVEQVLARDHPAGVAHQPLEQVVLAPGQVELGAVQGDLAPVGHDLEAAEAHRLQPLGVALGAAQHGADAGDHLGRAERLDHVVVGAQLEAHDAVELAAAGGEHDHGHVVLALQLAAHVAAVAVGQVQVQQHQVGLDPVGQLQRLGGRGGGHRLEALARQRLGERLRDRQLVLHEQDPRALAHAANVDPSAGVNRPYRMLTTPLRRGLGAARSRWPRTRAKEIDMGIMSKLAAASSWWPSAPSARSRWPAARRRGPGAGRGHHRHHDRGQHDRQHDRHDRDDRTTPTVTERERRRAPAPAPARP